MKQADLVFPGLDGAHVQPESTRLQRRKPGRPGRAGPAGKPARQVNHDDPFSGKMREHLQEAGAAVMGYGNNEVGVKGGIENTFEAAYPACFGVPFRVIEE